MAYYSKYTGAELEERLDKVEEIPQLIAQMITGKDFVTKEDLLCVLKDYAPADYRTIPIDNNTIYWENGVLKAATSGGGGQCQWELREHNGVQYLFSRLPVVTQYDVTMYADVNRLDLPNIYDGLPIDGDTIYWEETENGRILKSKYEGSSGVDASEVLSIVSGAGYATQNWVNNQNFINQSYLANELLKYVTIDNYQEIIGVKNFLNGIQIADLPITKLEGYEDVIYIDANVVVRGGLTMYSTGEAEIPSLTDSIVTDGITILNDNGVLKINPDIQLGGITEEEYNAIVNLINTKWTTDNSLINKWNTAYGWGNHASVGYALKSYVDDTFVTIKDNEDVTGVHDFVNGLKIGNIKLSKSQEGVVYLEGNLVVKGGVTMYALDEVTVDSIIDSLPLASTSEYGIAKFNPSNFVINEDGFVTIIGGSGGLDTEELAEYLATNKYATQGWVENKKYLTSHQQIYNLTISKNGTIIGIYTPNSSPKSLDIIVPTKLSELDNDSSFATTNDLDDRINDLINGAPAAYDTLKEIADVLSDNIDSIGDILTTLGTKANNSIKISAGTGLTGGGDLTSDRTLSLDKSGVSAGTYKSVTVDIYGRVTSGYNPTTLSGYGITDAYTKTQVDNTFKLYIPIAGYTEITGEKNFTGGLRVNNSPSIYYDETNKYWKLEGDLLVTGGVSMYSDDTSYIPSTIMDAVVVDGVTIKKRSEDGALYFAGTMDGGVTDFWELNNIPTWIGSSKPTYTLGSLQHVDSSSIDATATVDRVLFQQAGSATWVTKPLSEIGGGGSVSGNYLPLSGGTINGTTGSPLIIKTPYTTSAISIFANEWSTASECIVGLVKDTYFSKVVATLSCGAPRVIVPETGGVYYQSSFGATANEVLHSSNYSSYALPLSGGTINGSGSYSAIPLVIKNSNSQFNGLSIYAYTTERVHLGYWSSLGGVRLENVACTAGLSILNDKTPSYYKINSDGTIVKDAILHAGNYSSYALPLSGGTIKGSVLFEKYLILTALGNGTYNIGLIGVEDNEGFNLEAPLDGDSYESSRMPIHLTWRGGYVNKGGLRITNSDEAYLGGNKILHAGNYSSYALPLTGGTLDGSFGSHYIRSTYNNSAGFSEYEALNYTRAWFANTQTLSVPYNSVQVALGWSNWLHGQGYHTRYTISSVRFNGWGGMSLAVGANDEGTYRGVYLELWGSGTISAGGNLTVSGGITMYSDIRKKTKLQDVELSLSQIANAPLIQHYYNSDQNKTTHVGSIAQYWASLNDWFCKLDNEGYYTMEIQNCALASAISIARELVKYESKTDRTIRKMKQRIQELEDKLEKLEGGNYVS